MEGIEPGPFSLGSIFTGCADITSIRQGKEIYSIAISKDVTMFPGTDLFVGIPFHFAHTILETDQAQLDFEAKKLHSIVKEKSLIISDTGALADKISPGVLKSLVTLNDKPK
ncbi:hypothetical protein KIW84_072654 [Lathyrus oleraceus]|uniref:Uncharacterized protein n=1 Tax=Pisum sativum TaxID=3888 RepID=A0A9D4VLJ6_PEA|nr:hypothetical protein KIW84_072654 [Pisum sativum]